MENIKSYNYFMEEIKKREDEISNFKSEMEGEYVEILKDKFIEDGFKISEDFGEVYFLYEKERKKFKNNFIFKATYKNYVSVLISGAVGKKHLSSKIIILGDNQNYGPSQGTYRFDFKFGLKGMDIFFNKLLNNSEFFSRIIENSNTPSLLKKINYIFTKSEYIEKIGDFAYSINDNIFFRLCIKDGVFISYDFNRDFYYSHNTSKEQSKAIKFLKSSEISYISSGTHEVNSIFKNKSKNLEKRLNKLVDDLVDASIGMEASRFNI